MKILLIIPPFTQINTPYPSTGQLAGFLKSKGYEVKSLDLSLEVILKVFSRDGLGRIFSEISKKSCNNEYINRAIALSDRYTDIIEPVIAFLQGKNPNLAYRIVQDGFLPQGESFLNHSDEDAAFGYFGLQDKAKYYCSLVIDDLTRLIAGTIAPYFGLSRYAEKLAQSPPSFTPLFNELKRPRNLIEEIIIQETEKSVSRFLPDVIGYTIPFPGNLLGALISSAYLKEKYPGTAVVYGGGYVNTELRQLKDPRIFNYTDFITYDDGELPLLNIIRNIEGKNSHYKWIRTISARKGEVLSLEGRDYFPENLKRGEGDYFPANFNIMDNENTPPSAVENIYPENLDHNSLTAPCLDGIDPEKYIAMTEMLNPMHRLWSDGYWNKLTVAHGCYWRKCTFCDITLDYIKRYSPARAGVVVDWMEELMRQTGRSAFHFTDEAAPPSLLKEVAIEILRRRLSVIWWGNIRFEKAFTADLCRLLAASGLTAVSGGLEVADERLLSLINKGVTLKQVARVCRNFRTSGIMVHAYLMYGFPTQTEQEIINNLELVRQFLSSGLFQSAFWHRFSLTAHSPVARSPENYGIKIISPMDNPFANNDLEYQDLSGIDYGRYHQGLNKALYNFMHGQGFEMEVNRWFDFRVPPPGVKKNLIAAFLKEDENEMGQLNSGIGARALWMERIPEIKRINKNLSELHLHTPSAEGSWQMEHKTAEWIRNTAALALIGASEKLSLQCLRDSFPGGSEQFEIFTKTGIWQEIRQLALLFV